VLTPLENYEKWMKNKLKSENMRSMTMQKIETVCLKNVHMITDLPTKRI